MGHCALRESDLKGKNNPEIDSHLPRTVQELGLSAGRLMFGLERGLTHRGHMRPGLWANESLGLSSLESDAEFFFLL